ncbi:D-isomer specific 2-hydroxyacid dehydrogenase, catalytic domain-containing protein, partial [Cynara cardunculus var. scolymus]
YRDSAYHTWLACTHYLRGVRDVYNYLTVTDNRLLSVLPSSQFTTIPHRAPAPAPAMALAMKRAAATAVRAISSANSASILTRQLHASAEKKKIVGVFYKAHEYAEMNPNFLGCAENALGIRNWLESQGHEYIVTDDKEGPDCELEKHISDMHVLITTPFHPAYVTAERIKKAKNLQLLLTAGIGSDHVDLQAAAAAGLTVAEVTGSNVVSVAEDELMRILILVRNFLPGHHQVISGDWNVAGIAYRAYDLEGKTVGTVGCGRIGRLLLQRLKPFGCNLLYHDRIKMDQELENQIGAKFEEDLDKMLPKWYSGDVWYPQPAPKDHPWRYMPNQAMTPHISGTTIDAQLRYAAGVKDMLENYFKGEDFPAQHYIVKEGELASQYR